MHRVDQTRFSSVEPEIWGNCYSACLASIFHLPIEAVPELNTGSSEAWNKEVDDWLNFHGYQRFCIMTEDFKGHFTVEQVASVCIAFGEPNRETPRPLLHAVVWNIGKMWHDPHPSRAGLTEVDGFELFVPMINYPRLKWKKP